MNDPRHTPINIEYILIYDIVARHVLGTAGYDWDMLWQVFLMRRLFYAILAGTGSSNFNQASFYAVCLDIYRQMTPQIAHAILTGGQNN